MRRKHEMRPCSKCGEPVCNTDLCPSCDSAPNPVWDKLRQLKLSGSSKVEQETHNLKVAGSTPTPTTIPVLKSPAPFTWIDAKINVPRVGKHVLVAYFTGFKSGYCKQIIVAIRGTDGWHFIDARHRSKKTNKIRYWMTLASPPRSPAPTPRRQR